MALVGVWHNDGSNVSKLEKDTLKIYHVPGDQNNGILRIYAKFLEENPSKSTRRLSEELGASKDIYRQKIIRKL